MGVGFASLRNHTWFSLLEGASSPAQMVERALTENMLRTLEATLRAGRGDVAGGLHALEGGRTEVWFQYAMASPVFAGVEGRLLRAELLHQQGRDREATGWLGSIGWHSVWELSHRARAERRSHEISHRVEATI